jgi:Uma2 family endonuclease
MATAPTALMSIEEYLRTSYRPDCDFVDGHLEERNLGEFDHGTLQSELSFWFRSHRDEWQIRVISEQRTRVSLSRVRIPDVCVIRYDSAREPVRVTPPLLCIEILSPEDRLSRMEVRLADFLKMGVEHIWVIDPQKRSASIYTGSGLHPAGPRLEIPGTPIYLDLSALFAALD